MYGLAGRLALLPQKKKISKNSLGQNVTAPSQRIIGSLVCLKPAPRSVSSSVLNHEIPGRSFDPRWLQCHSVFVVTDG